MATKNLARTVIEGGRSRYHKGERRHSNRQARQRGRAFARMLLFDAEQAETSVAPVRRRVYRDHDDRLAAARRWLSSFVGQPWDCVRSEIARRFDTRTIAGQHIVFDHLLPAVRNSGCPGHARCFWEVDRGGILRLLLKPWG